jgi:hypothetical protein
MCTKVGCVCAKLGVVFVPAVRRFYHLEIFVSPAVEHAREGKLLGHCVLFIRAPPASKTVISTF